MAEVSDKQMNSIDKALRQSRWAPGLLAYLALALLNVVAIGGLAFVQYEFIQTRQETLRGGCLQQAAQAERNIASLVASAQVLVEVAQKSDPPSDPVILEAYLDGVRQSAQTLNPVRDCSEKGIAAYTARPPTPKDCRSDGKGFCLPNE